MSNIKISEMTEASSLQDNDLLTIVQGGVNKKITKSNAIGNIITALNNPTYVSGTGKSVTLNGTRVGPIKQKIKGETTQKTYTGKNLYAFGDLDISSSDYFVNSNLLQNFKNDTTYTLSFDANVSIEPFHASIGYGNYGYQADSTAYWTGLNSGHITLTFTTNNTTYNNLYMRIPRYGTTGTSWTAKLTNIQLEENSTATTYEPYVGGIPSPNPDYPQDVITVTGENQETICGKNLFDKTQADLVVGYIDNSGNIVTGGTSSATRGFIPIPPNTNVTLSGSSFTVYCFYDKNKNFIEKIVQAATSYTFNKNAYYLRFQGYTENINIDTIQLEIRKHSIDLRTIRRKHRRNKPRKESNKPKFSIHRNIKWNNNTLQ